MSHEHTRTNLWVLGRSKIPLLLQASLIFTGLGATVQRLGEPSVRGLWTHCNIWISPKLWGPVATPILAPTEFPTFTKSLGKFDTFFFLAAEGTWNFQLNSGSADPAEELGLTKHPGGPPSQGTPPALAYAMVRVPLPLLPVMRLGFSVGSWREPMCGGFLTCGEGWVVGGPDLVGWSPKHLTGREWGL